MPLCASKPLTSSGERPSSDHDCRLLVDYLGYFHDPAKSIWLDMRIIRRYTSKPVFLLQDLLRMRGLD
jgi:hypothetical protein